MDVNAIMETITTLQRNVRDVQRQLAEVNEFTSADYVHVSEAMRMLTEQMQQLLQLRNDVMQASVESQTIVTTSPTTINRDIQIGTIAEKRGRGGIRQFYLLDDSQRASYVAQIRTLFEQYYDADNRRFVLPDGTLVKAPLFLACLYDLGIRDGIASAEAPVKDFALIVKEAAANISTFTTAYNTIQNVIKSWREFVGDYAYYDRTVHLFSLTAETVCPKHQEEYEKCKEVMVKIACL